MDIRFLQIDNEIVSVGETGALRRIYLARDFATMDFDDGDEETHIVYIQKTSPAYANLMMWLYPQTLTLHADEQWRIPAPPEPEPGPEGPTFDEILQNVQEHAFKKPAPTLDDRLQNVLDDQRARRDQRIAANPEDADDLQKALAARRAQAREVAGPEFDVTTLNESKLIRDVLDTLDIYQDAHPGCNCLRCIKVNEGIFQLQMALETHVQHISEQTE